VKTIIIAGGLGTRLGLADIPKAMVPIGGMPLLHRTVDCFLRQGFRDFVFKLRHRADVIERYFGDGGRFGCRIEYIHETAMNGTAGGLRFLAQGDGDVFIVYGDLLIDADMRRMLSFHQEHRADATLLAHESQHPEDSDVLVASGDCVTKLIHKPGSATYGRLTNAGVYVMRRHCFSVVPPEGTFDFGTDVLPLLITSGKHVLAYRTEEYVKDVGTPVRLRQAHEDLERCHVSGELDAVFLDRDGTINEEVNLLHRVEDFRLTPGAGSAICALNRLRLPVLVATNQPVVARNLCSEADILRVHEHMSAELAREGARIDAVYYCPHHPETHHADGNPQYRVECDCRKPKIGMFMRGAAEFDLELRRCVLIGDSSTDTAAASAAGMRSILVRTGYGGNDAKYAVRPHYVVSGLPEAADLVGTLHRSSIDAVVASAHGRGQMLARPVIVAVGSASRGGGTWLTHEICARWPQGTASTIPFEVEQDDHAVLGMAGDVVVIEGTDLAELRNRADITVLAESAVPEAIGDAWRNADYVVGFARTTVAAGPMSVSCTMASSSAFSSVTRQ
jgi:histidinol-phosphate phosphatase family protein